MSRFYKDKEIDDYLAAQPKREPAETYSLYLELVTEHFKSTHQYQMVADVKYLRQKLGNHTYKMLPLPLPAQTTCQLDVHFNDHVLGDEAGKGWHSEARHANGTPGYSYTLPAGIASSKSTYWAQTVVIGSVKKTGNDGNTSFFPATLGIDIIRSDAMYVANTPTQSSKSGMVITGLGQRTGINIDCLMDGNRIISAYPHLEK